MQCAHFDAGRCRSCSLLQTPYPDQLAGKQARAEQALAAMGSVSWLAPQASVESGFRNKAKMVVGGSVEAPVLGIVDAVGRHTDLSDCALYPSALSRLFEPLRRFISIAQLVPYDIESRRGELKHALVTLNEHDGALMLRLVLRSTEAESRIRKHLPQLLADAPSLHVVSLNIQPLPAALLEGEREIVLTTTNVLAMRVNRLSLLLRPQGFFQTHSAMAAALYRQVQTWCDAIDPASVWDLFCGVGGFAFHVADGHRDVLGIEISAEAVAAASQSAADQQLPRIRFVAADADSAIARDNWPELLIVNPPRRGIGARLCRAIEESSTPWVVYSSCNIDSLRQDLERMPTLRVSEAQVLDMFPHTPHFETLVLLQRQPLQTGRNTS